MPFDINILTDKVEKLKTNFENGHFGDVLLGALNTGNGLMQDRIFAGNKDVEGNDFGEYVGKKKTLSDRAQLTALFNTKGKKAKEKIRNEAILELTSYQRKRLSKGRQIGKKDLEFTGELRRSIETQADERSAVLEFSNDQSALIARGQENQITNIRNGRTGSTKGDGIKIFNLSEDERTEVIDQGQELLNQILKP
jgi:hypothetical protein